MHALHRDVHEHGIVDGCGACADLAENPTANADESVLRAILERAVDRTIPGRSTNEEIAAANVLNTLERFGRLAEVAPDLVEWYLRDRWHIEVEFGPTAFTRAADAVGVAAPVRAEPDAEKRARMALKPYISRRGPAGATDDAWVFAAASLLNDLTVMLGDGMPQLEQVVALARRLELEP